MKNSSVKLLLLLIMLSGTASGLLMYNQILFLFSKTLDFTYNWIFIGLLFVISVVIARIGSKILLRDLMATKSFNEISLIKIFKFFIGGFVGCYVGFSIVGSLVLTIYLIFRNLFL